MGNARAQGADVEIPSLSDAKDEFDTWLMSNAIEGTTTGEMLIKRALGLKEG